MSVFITKSFRYSEFACPCCGKVRPISPDLIYRLQNLRDKIGKPIYISSGIRCKKYNRKVGGYRNSPHLTGKAVDIHAKNIDIVDLAIMARDEGFSRIGIYPYQHFIHIDILKPRPSKAWIKDNSGVYWYFSTLEDAISVI